MSNNTGINHWCTGTSDEVTNHYHCVSYTLEEPSHKDDCMVCKNCAALSNGTGNTRSISGGKEIVDLAPYVVSEGEKSSGSNSG